MGEGGEPWNKAVRDLLDQVLSLASYLTWLNTFLHVPSISPQWLSLIQILLTPRAQPQSRLMTSPSHRVAYVGWT